MSDNNTLFDYAQLISDVATSVDLTARYARLYYDAFIKHGFSEQQALSLTMHQLATQLEIAMRAKK